MKKTKIKFLTSAACLALIGTASAAWVYAGTATASANIGVKVASYADAGTITVTGATKINILLDNKSVKFVKDSESDVISAKYNKPSNVDTTGKTVEKTFKVLITPVLYDYIAFGSTIDADKVENFQTSSGTGTALQANGLASSSLVPFAWEDDIDIFENLPSLVWNDGKCPTNETEYKNLINTISANTITDENWISVQNQEWNATEMNADWVAYIYFYAKVVTA